MKTPARRNGVPLIFLLANSISRKINAKRKRLLRFDYGFQEQKKRNLF